MKLPVLIVKSLLPSVSSDTSRGSLCSVLVESRDGLHTCTSTNGAWLCQITYRPDAAEYVETHGTIPRATLKSFVSSKGFSPLVVDPNTSGFPDVSQVIPERVERGGAKVVGIDAHILQAWSQSVKALFGAGKCSTRWGFDGPLSPIRVDAEHPSAAKVEGVESILWVIMPMRLD